MAMHHQWSASYGTRSYSTSSSTTRPRFAGPRVLICSLICIACILLVIYTTGQHMGHTYPASCVTHTACHIVASTGPTSRAASSGGMTMTSPNDEATGRACSRLLPSVYVHCIYRHTNLDSSRSVDASVHVPRQSIHVAMQPLVHINIPHQVDRSYFVLSLIHI